MRILNTSSSLIDHKSHKKNSKKACSCKANLAHGFTLPIGRGEKISRENTNR